MIGFLVAASLMVGVAMVFVLPPLLRSRARTQQSSSRELNLAVYQNQLRELEADVAAGTLSADRFEASKLELQRRLLEDVPIGDEATRAAARRSPKAAITVGVLVPAAAGLLYLHLGTPAVLLDPGTQTASSPHGQGHGVSFEQIDILARRLAERLVQEPDDAEGWAMLARSYNVLGRHALAATAYAKATRLLPGNAQLLADYADALAMSQDGRLEGKPLELVQRALKADARNVKALALAGTSAFDRRDYAAAVGYWERAVWAAGEDGEFAESLKASLSEARALAGSGRMPIVAAKGVGTAAVGPGDEPAGAPRRVTGRIALAPELAAQTSPSDTLFVFARAAHGPRMPLALLRRQVKDLPLEFALDDSVAMSPSLKLSSFDRVIVVARISKGDTAEARPGDFEGTAGPVPVGASGVRVKIDQPVR